MDFGTRLAASSASAFAWSLSARQFMNDHPRHREPQFQTPFLNCRYARIENVCDLMSSAGLTLTK